MSCPVCQKDSQKSFRPFCSERCANVDLGKWLNESYRIPATEEAPEIEFDDTPSKLH